MNEAQDELTPLSAVQLLDAAIWREIGSAQPQPQDAFIVSSRLFPGSWLAGCSPAPKLLKWKRLPFFARLMLTFQTPEKSYENPACSKSMRILSLLVLIVAVYFVAHGDQHASRATVIAADGRVWNSVRIDWTLAGDLQLRDPTGRPVASLPEKTTSYSYETDSRYLGVFAWVAFAVTIGYGA
jgi:hypothetical protein